MATPARLIILIVACACLVDSHFLRRRFNKQQTSPADHHITEKSEDPDAVIFPYEEEAIVFEQANKHINAEVHKHVDDKDSKTDIDLEVKNVPLTLISKAVPEKEIKDVFTNPVASEDTETGTGLISDVKEPVIDTTEDKLVPNEPLPDTDINIQENKTIEEDPDIKLNYTIARNNDIVPDLSSRFAVTGNYMLVPVAANVQGYQPIQTNQNALMSTMQGNTFQTQVPTELNTNAINPQHDANVGSNVNYTPHYPIQTANVAPNVGTDVQYVTPNIGANVFHTPNTGSNIGSQYVAPNYNNNQANVQVNGNTYVPVSVPNTYMINGQLYAAVTVPSTQVPSSLYYVNPQVSSYQVPNNVPLYKLVSLGDGARAVNGNMQYVPNNQNQ